jgi:dihydroorotase
MINSRFTYASPKVGFGTQSASLQKLKASQSRIASSLASTQSTLASITSSFESAQQDKIDGLATLAAKAGIARVQAQAKAKSAEITKQIDSAQKSLDASKDVTKHQIIVGHTIVQPYVSLVYSPPATTTDTTA